MAYKKKTNDELINLKKQLKEGKLSPLYLFYGEEEYLRETYVQRITEQIPDGGFPEFNHIKLTGGDIPFTEYDEAWESFPMMTDKRLIHIRNSGIFKSRGKDKENAAAPEEIRNFWEEKFKHIADDTVVIFDEVSADKNNALYKAASKAGQAVEFKYLSEADLTTWVIKQCLDSKVKISKDNAYYLVTRCDSGLRNLNNELGKLFDFCRGEILRSDIDRVVSKSLQMEVFELTNAIIDGDTAQAMTVLRSIRMVADSAFNLFYLMLSSLERLLRVKLMEGAPQQEIFSALGINYYIGRKYIESARGFSAESLKWMMKRIAEMDLAIKEGRIDEWNALEQYIMECIYRGRN